MYKKRCAGFCQQSPEFLQINMSRRLSMGGSVRYPDGLKTGLYGEFQLCIGEFSIVKRHNANAHQSIVRLAKVNHVTVMRSGGAVTKIKRLFCAGVKRESDAVGCKDQLLAKAQHVHCGGPVLLIEGAKGLNFLGTLDQLVSQINHRLNVFSAMNPALGHDDVYFFIAN